MVSAATYSSITLGDTRITFLPDGYILFDQRALFPTITAADWQPYQHLLNDDDRLVGSMGAYLVQTPERRILVDTGLGTRTFEGAVFKAYGGKLLSNLELAGLSPDDIDTVFFTHMHSDHVGWTGREVNGELAPTFPNARHLVRSAEWHRFDDPAVNRAMVVDALNVLEHRIEFVEDGEHLTPEVKILATPGHTIGHASLLVTVGEERAIILGDIFHSEVLVEHPEWPHVFDSDPEQAKATRRQILHELAMPSTIGVATHTSNSVFGRVTRVEDGFRWQGL